MVGASTATIGLVQRRRVGHHEPAAETILGDAHGAEFEQLIAVGQGAVEQVGHRLGVEHPDHDVHHAIAELAGALVEGVQIQSASSGVVRHGGVADHRGL